MGFYYNGTASDKLSGPAYLTWNGTLFNIHYLYSELDLYPYSGVYGQIVVSDVNKDGYDDVIIYVQRRESLVGAILYYSLIQVKITLVLTLSILQITLES